VVFVTTGNIRKCPACGYQFEISPQRYSTAPVATTTSGEWVGTFGLIIRVLLVMVAVVVVVIGVLFAGCVIALKGI